MSYLASGPPARGAPTEDLLAAAAVAFAGLIVAALVSFLFYRGGAKPLRWGVRLATRISGLPEWAALPSALIGASLVTAVFGLYWDVASHIDNGRDAGPFANAAHYPILFGLVGIAVGGLLSILISVSGDSSSSLAQKLRRSPRGAWLVALCGTIALAGFPLDEVWHRLFGQDVTLWGPTHIQMVAGASLSTLGLWVLLAEGYRDLIRHRPGWLAGLLRPSLGGAFLLGLSTLQGEFDFGVPQFRLLYHPVMIVIAASIGLVTVRVAGRSFDALKSVLFFLAIRSAISLAVGPAFGHQTLHFPLYLAEALIVEAVGMRRERLSWKFGALCGALIATLGLAAEWAWSHLWMPIEWPTVLLPETAALALLSGVGGGVLGTSIGASISRQSETPPRGVRMAAAIAVVLGLAYPGFTDQGADISAQVALTDVKPQGVTREALVSVRIDPSISIEDAAWFHILSWQGKSKPAQIIELIRSGPGEYESKEPVPVGGSWKTLVRLHKGRELVGLPIYLPEDLEIPAPGVEALPRFRRQFMADHLLLQREAVVTDPTVHRLGYVAILLIVLAWLWAFARVLFTSQAAHPRDPSEAAAHA